MNLLRRLLRRLRATERCAHPVRCDFNLGHCTHTDCPFSLS